MKRKEVVIPRDDEKSVLDWERFHVRCKKDHAMRKKIIAAHAVRVKEDRKVSKK